MNPKALDQRLSDFVSQRPQPAPVARLRLTVQVAEHFTDAERARLDFLRWRYEHRLLSEWPEQVR